MYKTPAGWYADPWSGRKIRYWNGQEWTPRTDKTSVARAGHEARWAAAALLLVATAFVALVVQPLVLR